MKIIPPQPRGDFECLFDDLHCKFAFFYDRKTQTTALYTPRKRALLIPKSQDYPKVLVDANTKRWYTYLDNELICVNIVFIRFVLKIDPKFAMNRRKL